MKRSTSQVTRIAELGEQRRAELDRKLTAFAGAVRGEPIAIVGAGCRFPGGVNSFGSLAKLLLDGVDAVTEVPATRWDVGRYYDPEPRTPGRTQSRWGGYLEDPAGFDAGYFGINPSEAEAMDPQHRVFLEVAWEALEHAGIRPRGLSGGRTGVFAGFCHADYLVRLADSGDIGSTYLATGITHSVGAGRVAYLLGVHGPVVAVDTACSTGLVTVHQAAQSLRNRECDVALAGAAVLHMDPKTAVSFSQWGMLSPSGRCRAFDADADGFVRSEGCGVVVLKRLGDALDAGDRILGVLRATAVNHDGRSNGLTAPSPVAQRDVIEQALSAASIDVEDVRLIEAHGPGTPIGDPIEFSALAATYATVPVPRALGSIKTNLGHTESASGVAGLLKVLVAMRARTIPANLHFRRWNPEIDPDGTGLFIPTAATPWPDGAEGPLLGSVSSFGLGGTNAHAIVESAPERAVRRPRTRPQGIFTVSGSTAAAAAETAHRIADWMENGGGTTPLADVGATLAALRDHRNARLAVVAGTRTELADRLRAAAREEIGSAIGTAAGTATRAKPMVWAFSGQGAQWARMGAALLDEPAFAAVVDELEPLIAAESGFSVRETLQAAEVVTGIDRVQPTLLVMQLGLAAIWRSHGATPAAVIGQSMGEVAAAIVAGALTPADGVKVICRRTRLMSRIAGAGAMASVELPRAEAERDLPDGVTVAVVSSPGTTVVAGDTAEIDRLIDLWEDRDVPVRRISVDVASHSPQVDPILDELAANLADLDPGRPAIAFYGTVLDDPRAVPDFDAAYWVANLRRPVQLADGVAAAAADGYQLFVELSPHPLITKNIEEICAHAGRSEATALGAMRRGEDPLTTVPAQIAAAHCAGAELDLTAWHPEGSLADAPPTAWNHTGFLVPVPRAGRRAGGGHPLLGAHADTPDGHRWSADVGLESVPWLGDHRVNGIPLFPTAGYVEMAFTAGSTAFAVPAERIEITDLRIPRALELDARTRISTSVSSDGLFRVRVLESEWETVATARLRVLDEAAVPAGLSGLAAEEIGRLRAAHAETLDPDAVYAGLRARGVEHGPAFSGLTGLAREPEGGVLAEVRVPPVARSVGHDLQIHPGLFDSCLQASAAPLVTGNSNAAVLPVGIDRVRLHAAQPSEGLCAARLTGFRLLSADGAVLLEAEGLRLAEPGPDDSRLLAVTWQETAPLPEPSDTAGTGRWAVMAEDPGDPLAEALRSGLEAAEDTPGGVVYLVAPERGDQGERGRVLVEKAIEVIARFSDDAPRVWFVTRDAQPVLDGDGQAVAQSALRALIKSAGHEHPEMRVSHLDLDGGADAAAIVRELAADTPEDEVALRGERRFVARLTPAPLHVDERRRIASTEEYVLACRTPGDLSSLEIRGASRREPGPGEVEVRMRAASLNYADVLNAMGLYKTVDGVPVPLGSDGAGVVVRVGPGVTWVTPGRRVALLAPGTLGSHVTAPETALMPVPDDFDDVTAAALPSVYATAWYGLVHCARIAFGETVLIHSATGGVGQAAIRIARSFGARIIATAGSDLKRAYLREQGIEHVLDSRTLEFAGQVAEITGGEGVDIVLNTLTGAAQRAGLALLKVGGRFIELTKRDIYADNSIELTPFRRNITFASVDLGLVGQRRPADLGRVLSELAERFDNGELGALPVTARPLAQAADVFRTMAAADHLGKLVITLPEGPVEAWRADSPVARDASYIVTGGLGGIGLKLLGYLAGNGAGRVVLNARSAPTPQAEQAIAAARAAGCDVQVVRGDLADQAAALVEAATAGGLRLAGVAHAAAVVADATLLNADIQLIERVWRPKVQGGRRLHEAVGDTPLDWWLNFSSGAGLLGMPGQGVYGAANAWLDGFTTWQRARGVPSVSIAWGAWAEVGAGTGMAARGYTMIDPADGIAAIDRLLRHDRARVAYLPCEPEVWRKEIPAVATAPFWSELARADEAGGELAGPVGTTPPELERHLLTLLQGILKGVTVDPHVNLTDLGVDSLMSLELRGGIERSLGVRVPVKVLRTHETVAELAVYLSERLASA
ncbi:SDR family NAD(P)-dependent oxidoreductase [Nonomuraea sp. NPDC050663]|uniref:SDR family NAD(P)-dependent oxidoreductase n=1 Tax=Nonomuraea sp. NPDC050663 TaxID=3364370 RepID=UPI00378801C6